MRIMIVDSGFDFSTLPIGESYERAFRRLGYEVAEYDTLRMKNITLKGFAGRNNINELTEMVIGPLTSQVINEDIEVVLMIHGYWMNNAIIDSLKKIACKTGLILTDDPLQVDVSKIWSSHYDYVFTNDRRTQTIHGKNCHYLPVAVDETIFNPGNKHVKDKANYESDIFLGMSLYNERFDFIESNERFKEILLSHNTKIIGGRSRDFKDDRLNALICDKKITYEELAKYTANAKIVIDIPRNEFSINSLGDTNRQNMVKASCLSPRIFECFASKTLCLTTNERSDIRNLFDDMEYCTWDEPDQLCDLIEDKLENITSDFTKKFLDAQYEWVFNSHTYLQRAIEIEKIMGLTRNNKTIVSPNPINMLEMQWESNFDQLKRYYVHSGNLKRASCDAKMILVSNGPSLEKYDGVCCDRKGSMDVVLCVNEAIKIFKDKDISGIVIHPGKDIYDRVFKDTQFNRQIPLFLSSLSYWEITKKWIDESLGDVTFFHTAGESEIKSACRNYRHFPIFNSAKTVGYSAMALAISCAYKNIDIYGLDFCYLDNKKYAYTKLEYSKIPKAELVVMADKNDQPILTTRTMLDSRNKCLELIRTNTDVKFKVFGGGILFDSTLTNLENDNVSV